MSLEAPHASWPPDARLAREMSQHSPEPRRARRDRPRVFYVSYDGIGEPLGRSQVLGYLARLAYRYDITLISFEKAPRSTQALRAELARSQIRWVSLHYHRRPPVVSTLRDVLAGRRALVRAARLGAPEILHVRSYVPALIALTAGPMRSSKLLFDIRGFWADERVEGGLWRRGTLYRVAKWCERRFFSKADAVVTLTRASVPTIREWTGERHVSVEVIPTCVDLQRFGKRPRRSTGPHAIWCGSIGTWYRFDLAPRFVAALSLPLTVLTKQSDLARQLLGGYPAAVESAPPEDIPALLFEGDIGLCLIASSFSKTASAPTRFAEYLAAGMPVVVTPGVGDLPSIVTEERVGTVLRGEDEASIAGSAAEMLKLLADPALPDRCRSVARQRFDIDTGSEQYAALYERLIEA